LMTGSRLRMVIEAGAGRLLACILPIVINDCSDVNLLRHAVSNGRLPECDAVKLGDLLLADISTRA
jgi:hypothetical protein